MFIFPAIDLIEGQVVRLYQGDYDKKKVYSDDPLSCVKRFYDDSARCLHMIDLDGAKMGKQRNFDVVRGIAETYPDMLIELGGGIRNIDTVEQCLEAGVKRVILGTSALKDIEFTSKMLREKSEQVAIGVDARDNKVAVEGWTETSDQDSIDFCFRMRDLGAKYIIYTDISKDGAGKGTNLDIYERLSRIEGLEITASGGVTTLEEISILREMGIYAAIIGKALYTGDIILKDALLEARK
ncbi:MAG: 1-(5-phosphoribosyl)-5-[(5-phosphoribosylamino)methylideneamino]imidazole-4-carboxamide isomerase [Ruminococcaceae bacterium]|nr:1-(5-phosphoribosyl)-5-[(5-phosphoribosylamino)methylideneamino]imidazole-4-carboxamide isomerase [Oscillospiraceae bacterium]